jgi:selenophosphate synthetase-related protein
VVFISDTHGRHDSVRVPACDVLCHCGDIMFMGGKF